MTKTKLILFLLVASFFAVNAQDFETHISTFYNAPLLEQDSVLAGLNSIRGMAYADDPYGDGTSLIALSNYNEGGFVHIFASAGNDSLELVWSSPAITENGGGSTPRYPLFGDLDNDGLIEIMFLSNGNGVYIYEWDGVAGSNNFGTKYSQLIGSSVIEDPGNNEYMEITDVDGDGKNELLTINNATNDGYYIISAIGNWVTDEPGFSSFSTEFKLLRIDGADYGLSGGTPYTMSSGDFNGDGTMDIMLHNWNNKNISPLRVTGPNSYEMASTANGKGNLMISDADRVSLFGTLTYDVDGDGADELYMPGYSDGIMHMIHYAKDEPFDEIDTNNVVVLPTTKALFGYGYGDIDGDGKPNIYTSSSYPYNVTSLEYQGGDIADTNNWKYEMIYPGENDIYTKITYSDSAGVLDTAYSVQTAFASKIWGRDTDFDSDGKEDILLPYQALNEVITVIHSTWSGTEWTSDTTEVTNDKRWGFRVLEAGPATGIEAKELTIIAPKDFKLEQNYPNPFNPTTNIRFSLPLNKQISLKVYDMLGREVKTLIDNQEFNKGSYEITWNATNNAGQKVASGNYIYQLKFGNFTKSMKMSLLK